MAQRRGPATIRDTSHGGLNSPQVRACQVRSRRRRGLKGQTLQVRAWGETMEHKMDLQVGLIGPPPGALFSISRDQSDRRATPNSDHQSAIASPSNTEIALKIAKITHSICRRPKKNIWRIRRGG